MKRNIVYVMEMHILNLLSYKSNFSVLNINIF